MATEIKTEIDLLLEARDATHGKYEKTAAAAQAIKAVLHKQDGWYNLEDDAKEALDMWATKVGRILGGNPDTIEHWIDCAGYSQLIVNRLKGKR